MSLTFGDMTYIEALEDIGTELKVGVSFFDDREYFFIVGKDADGQYNKVSLCYSCDVGLSVGDLIGAVEPVSGVMSSAEVVSAVTDKYSEIKNWIVGLKRNQNKVKMVNSIILMSNELFHSNVVDVPFNKNLIALPLFVEIMSGYIKDGISYNFKKSDRILSALKRYQKSLAIFAEDVMLYEKNTDPAEALTRIDIGKIPSLSFSGYTTLINFNLGTEKRLTEAFIPDTFDDLISYLLNRYVLNYHFYCCANCRRYFAFSSNSMTKNCTRVIESAHYLKDIGRTCHDVGRLRAHTRGLYSDETQLLYQRNYKAAFARKKKGQISEENFTAWGEEARQMRDKCIKGHISYDELEQWFLDNYLRE